MLSCCQPLCLFFRPFHSNLFNVQFIYLWYSTKKRNQEVEGHPDKALKIKEEEFPWEKTVLEVNLFPRGFQLGSSFAIKVYFTHGFIFCNWFRGL